jgi:polysaccharide biosynthesis transport protein
VTTPVDYQTARTLNPDVVLEVWHRRKWIGLMASAAVLAGAISAVMSLPNLYRATATVLVEQQQVSEAFVRPSVTSELETRIQTIEQQVMSRARLTDVITRLNLYPDVREVVPMDALVERMRNEVGLDLRGTPQASGRYATIAFTLSYSGRDPGTVARVANTLAELYVEENTASRERQAALTAEFLEQQLAIVKRDLDEQDRRIAGFKVQYSGELLQQVEVNLAALDRLNTQLRLNAENQIRAMERRERIEGQLAEAESGGQGTLQADTPAARLARLNRELAQLRGKFSEQYPDVIRLKAEIALVQQEMAAKGDADGDPTTGGADSSLRLARQTLGEVAREFGLLKKEEEFLRRAIAQYEARVENAPKRQQDLQQLSRDYDLTNERYQTLLKRYEEAQLAEHLEQSQNVEQFRVLDPAIPPTRPAAPNRLWLLVMGVIASLGCGLVAIVAAEKLDTSFHDIDDLQAFANLPILTTIRLIRTTAGASRQRRRGVLTALAVALGLGLIVAGSYYVAAGNEQLTLLTARPRT